jgi:translation initiation factor IF-2
LDQNLKPLTSVSFSTPFTVSGFDKLPIAGETFEVVRTKKEAEDYILNNKPAAQADKVVTKHDADSVFLPIIIKSDVVGSKEAIEFELRKIQVNHVIIKVIKSETGEISEADAKLALTNERTVIIGFNVKSDIQARSIIERNSVPFRNFSIIYEIPTWIKEIAESVQPTVMKEEVVAEVKVLKIFGSIKKLQIIGAKVRTGTVEKNLKFKIIRRTEEIGYGSFKGLQRAKQEVDSVPEPEEFGCAIDSKIDLAESDILQVVKMIQQ